MRCLRGTHRRVLVAAEDGRRLLSGPCRLTSAQRNAPAAPVGWGEKRGGLTPSRSLGGHAMTTADITASGLSETEHGRQLRRAIIASTVGTTIEWYDFLLYGQVTGLVFGKLFFPQSDPLVAVLQASALFFIGFVCRPIGAWTFAHWCDP